MVTFGSRHKSFMDVIRASSLPSLKRCVLETLGKPFTIPKTHNTTFFIIPQSNVCNMSHGVRNIWLETAGPMNPIGIPSVHETIPWIHKCFNSFIASFSVASKGIPKSVFRLAALPSLCKCLVNSISRSTFLAGSKTTTLAAEYIQVRQVRRPLPSYTVVYLCRAGSSPKVM